MWPLPATFVILATERLQRGQPARGLTLAATQVRSAKRRAILSMRTHYLKPEKADKRYKQLLSE